MSRCLSSILPLEPHCLPHCWRTSSNLTIIHADKLAIEPTSGELYLEESEIDEPEFDELQNRYPSHHGCRRGRLFANRGQASNPHSEARCNCSPPRRSSGCSGHRRR